MFTPFSRKKAAAAAQKKKRHAHKGGAKSSNIKGCGTEARKTGANAGAPDGWRLDYSKMVEDMRNIDISSLQVVELPFSTSGQKITGGSTDRNSITIPLNIVQQDASRKERPAADKSLPDGWTELTSRTTGKIYFGNVHTGQSSWERPTQPATQVMNATVTARAAPAVSIPSLQLQEDDSDGEIVEERSDIAPAQGHDAAGTMTQDQRPAHQPDRLYSQQERFVMASHWPNQVPPIDLSAVQELGEHVSVNTNSLASHQLDLQRQAKKDYRLWLLSVTHLVLTTSCCSATCVLVAMKAAWERDEHFAVARQCRDGQPPPLAEWALIMSIALLMFAAAAHISLGSQKPTHKHNLARCLLLGICASDLACFLVGNVLVFVAFPNAGCSATWTSAHADYIVALVIIICTYVGYALAFICWLICWLRDASDGRAVDMGAETSESTNGADEHAHAHSLVQLNALGNSAATGSSGSARRCCRVNSRVA